MEEAKIKILVAEDNEFNMAYLEEVLSMLGYDIVKAVNGVEALELFNQYPDIKLCLLDVKMPEMNGYDLAFAIRDINPDIPLIAQTAYALDFEQARYNSAFDAYITKPIKKENLVSTLNQYLK
jgi:hypothetical protein